MPATYEPIATTTLGTAANSITFNSIPNTYTDLVLVVVAISPDTGSRYGVLRFNGDTGSNYSFNSINGTGSSAVTNIDTNYTSLEMMYDGTTNAAPTLQTWHIMSYAGSTYKTVLGQVANDKNGSGTIVAGVGLWRNTSAITSVTWKNDGGSNYAVGTTATLYGIKAA